MSDNAGIISIRGVTKKFGATVAVDDAEIDVRENEFFALLGPSGCGKTTLLRMIAGFEMPTEGQILIDGQDVSQVPPNKRPVNMVFQSYAVFPHMTVFNNVAYGLRVVGESGNVDSRVREALDMVQLGDYATRKPNQLSGGQRQRVALARALVKKPKVLLLDEPLSALDAKLRDAMRLELVRLQHSVGITFIIVTHDQDEALSMADRIAVMEKGKVKQIAPPAELYEYPNSRFVADFIGRMNLLQGKVKNASGGKLTVEIDGAPDLSVPHDAAIDGEVDLAIRPEKVRLEQSEPTGERIRLRGRVAEVAYYGGESHVSLDCGNGVMLTAFIQNAARSTDPAYRQGEELWISWAPADTLVLTD